MTVMMTSYLLLQKVWIGVSKTMAEKVDLSLDYVYGGEDREGNDLDEHVVMGLNFNF